MRFDKLSQNIEAGGIWRLGMAANDLQIVDCVAPLSITLYKGGAVIGSGSGVLAGDFFRGVDFDQVDISSIEAQEVTILLSDGFSGSNRIIGSVSVRDAAVTRSLSGQAFIGNYHLLALGGRPLLQVLNPVGSGVNLVVRSALLKSSVDSSVVIGSTELIADPGNPLSGVLLPKMFGGSSGRAEAYQKIMPSSAGPADATVYFTTNLTANTWLDLPLDSIVIPPGFGMYAMASTLSAALDGAIDFYETYLLP